MHSNSGEFSLLNFPSTVIVDDNLHKWVGEFFAPIEDDKLCYAGVNGQFPRN